MDARSRRRCPHCTRSTRALLREDFTHAGHALRHAAELVNLDPILLVTLYRLSHGAYFSRARPLAWVFRAWAIVLFSTEIHPRACLGRRLHIAHVGGILVGQGVVTGDDLKLFARTTLGGGRDGAWPVVGAGVTLFTGACVTGPARLGDGARVGANAFVWQDVPAGATASVGPARIDIRRDPEDR